MKNKEKWKIAREYLKELKVGDEVMFKEGVKGLVIIGLNIKEECVVNNKSILLTKDIYLGLVENMIAKGFLNSLCRKLKWEEE